MQKECKKPGKVSIFLQGQLPRAGDVSGAGVPRSGNEGPGLVLVNRKTFEPEIVQRLPAKRPCRVINEYGKEVVFRLYGAREQHMRCSKAITHVGKGKDRRIKLKPNVKCEYCGGQIWAGDLFWWRLYGLCAACHDRSQTAHLDDCVLVSRTDAGVVSRWERPGGREN
jgi:hypothetical protein